MKTTTPIPVSWETIQKMLGLTLPASTINKVRAQQVGGAASGATIAELLARQCVDGERTQHLTSLAGSLLAAGFGEVECIKRCLKWNSQNIVPLDDDKVVATCRSICASDQRNHPERYLHLLPVQPLFDLKAGRIDRYLTSDPAPRRWLLKDTVVLGKAGAVIAPGGSSKSQWLLQLAVGVATGLPVAEHWEIGEQGSVIVFFAEDDDDEIHRRIKRIQKHLTGKGHGAALKGVEDHLYVFSTIGKNMLLTRSDASGEVSSTQVVDSIMDLAKQLSDLRLIVIDPASRFRGGEENSNEDATRFVEALETLAKATGASVMLAHHTNKGSYGADGEPGQGASRGASALTDGLRWQMNLNRLSERQAKEIGVDKALLGQYVAATVTKTNYSAPPAPVILERLDGGYLSVVSGARAKNQAEYDAVIRVLQIIQRTGAISAREIEDSYGGMKQPLKMAKQHVREVIKIAVAKGYLKGGQRQPLSLEPTGTEMLRCSAPTELATCDLKTPPRKKVVINQ